MAYGGKLKYNVAFYSSNGMGTFNLEPQVLIKGGRTRKQVIYMDAPAPENGVRQEQEVGMKEVTVHSFHLSPLKVWTLLWMWRSHEAAGTEWARRPWDQNSSAVSKISRNDPNSYSQGKDMGLMLI